MLFGTEKMKDNSLSLNKEIYFEFPMLTSKLNQSFRVEGKNECLKQFDIYMMVYCCSLF